MACIFGINFSGFFAWWLWRTIYLSKLPGLDKKVRVAFEWTLDLLFRKDVCAVHHRSRLSDCYYEGHHEITFGSNGNGRPAPSPETSLSKLIHAKKAELGEYPAPTSSLDRWAS